MREWLNESELKRGNSGGYVLAALLAVLAAGVGYVSQLAGGYHIDTSSITAPEARTAAKPKSAPISVPRTADIAAIDLQETTARPLFFAERRPPQAPEVKIAAPVPEQPPPSPLKLVGIARIGGQDMVLVRGDKEPGRWLGEGEEYRGWQLKKIEREKAVVQAHGHVSELKLFPPKGQQQEAIPDLPNE